MKLQRNHWCDPHARAGFTLIEALISIVLISLVASGAMLVGKTGSRAYENTSVRNDLFTRARRTIDRIALELASSGPAVCLPNAEAPAWSEAFQFRLPVGVTGTAIDWGPAIQFRLEYEDGELNDGVDNDGDGLIDEGQVVRIEDAGGPNQRQSVLCRGVSELLAGESPNLVDDNGNGLSDERGFSLARSGDVVAVRLTLERQDAQGQIVVQSMETSVRLRN